MREALLVLLAVLSIIAVLWPIHRDYAQAPRRHKLAMGIIGSSSAVVLLILGFATGGLVVYVKVPSTGSKIEDSDYERGMGVSEILTVEGINASLDVSADQGEIFTLRRDSGEEMRVESKDFLTGTDAKVVVGDRVVRTVNGFVPVKLPCRIGEEVVNR